MPYITSNTQSYPNYHISYLHIFEIVNGQFSIELTSNLHNRAFRIFRTLFPTFRKRGETQTGIFVIRDRFISTLNRILYIYRAY